MKRVLISPLDWGLGHATRCVPVIQQLLDTGAEVIIAADGNPYEMLKMEFPNLRMLRLPGYRIDYPSKGSMTWHMFSSLTHILRGIKAEHEALQKILREEKIDLVISDNRFGLSSDKVKCVFISHQVYIQAPFGKRILSQINKSYIKQFSECWIPDVQGPDNLCGLLAHTRRLPKGYYFIGPLSRFHGNGKAAQSVYNQVITLSGPEPQRSILETELISQARELPTKSLLLRGQPGKGQNDQQGSLEMISHLPTQEMQKILKGANFLIGRSGYSSIMDAAALGKKCIFIPTPGQTEQEYLAEYHAAKGHCVALDQSGFNLEKALDKAAKIKGFEQRNFSDEALRKNMERILN